MVEKTKKCPECGKELVCQHNQDCWCIEYKLTKETLEFLQKAYPDCLCQDCLSHYADIKN